MTDARPIALGVVACLIALVGVVGYLVGAAAAPSAQRGRSR